MSRHTTSPREHISLLRSLARAKVRCGTYTSIDSICDELKGKVALYRKLGATTTPQGLRLDPATIQAWEIDAKIFAQFAANLFWESKDVR